MMATLKVRRKVLKGRDSSSRLKRGAPTGEDLKRWKDHARRLLDQEIDFIANAEFGNRGAYARIITRSQAESDPSSRTAGVKIPKDLPAHLARLCETKLLNAEEERDLFRQMNYLKYRANVLRTRLNPEEPDIASITEIEHCLKEASKVRDSIIKANMRLVISIVKKFVTPRHSFDDLLSDGIVSLMHAVDKFDYDKGFRFSTYAYRAIARNAYRTITDRHKEDSRFDTAVSDDLCNVPEGDRVSSLDEKVWTGQRNLLIQLMGQLDRRERFILRGRFALGSHRKVRTFQCLANKLGVSKERVRQLEQRAIAKLQALATDLQVEGA